MTVASQTMLVRLCTSALLLLAALPLRAEAPSEDAAFYYWKAVALMREAQTPEDLDFLAILQQELDTLPPAAFASRPRIARWLLEDSAAVDALQAGAARKTCTFVSPTDVEAFLNLDHLAPLKRLSGRVMETARVYDYVENPRGAAALYADLFHLAFHLDQDQNLRSGIVGAELVQSLLVELEGFLGREQPANAVAILDRCLRGAPHPAFHIGQYIRHAATGYRSWLLARPQEAVPRLRALYAGSAAMPAVEQLMSLDDQERLLRLTGWLDDLVQRSTALADALEKPYQIGLYDVRELDAAKRRIRDAAPGPEVNPLVPLLLRTMEKNYDRFLLAEGHLAIAEVLTAAALYQADLKRWPRDLEEISKYLGRTFPRDPFTGQDVQYGLKKGLPVVAVRAPKWLAREPAMIYGVNLSARAARDTKAVEAYAKALKRKARREVIRERQKDMDKQP